MARTASMPVGRKPSRRKTKKAKQPLFPPNVHQFLARRLTDGVGALHILLGLFLILSLFSYSADDISLNAVTSDVATQNWMGGFGAVISDLLLQSFGVVSYIVGFVAIFWGGRIILRKSLTRLSLRILGILCVVLCYAIALAAIPTPEAWQATSHISGSVGVLLFNGLTGALNPILGSAAHYLVAGFGVVFGCLFALLGFGAKMTEWHALKARMVAGIVIAFSFLRYQMGRVLKWHDHYENMPQVKPEISRTRKRPPVAEDKKASKPSLNLKIIAPKKTTQGKRKEQEKQPSLKLTQNTDWDLPPLDLLAEVPTDQQQHIDEKALQQNAELLHGVLQDFNVQGNIIKVNPGPIVTLYEFEPAPGTKSSRVINLADDIARSMSATSVRVAVIPGKNALGIEMPNVRRETVYMRELLSSRSYEMSTAKLPLILGKDIGGEPIIADLARMPHLLVAGTTGSGKSVSINTMLLSLLYRHSPETCRLILIDPKMLELSVYDDIPHLMTPVVTEPHKAITSLKWAVHEMEDRYRAMSKLGVRNIEGYNKRIREAQKTGEIIMHKVQTGFDPETGKPIFEEQAINLVELPYIVIVVDEFADLMLAAGKEVENAIQRLAQMARAAGLHLIMATQRPSVDVITGVIKANFPTRISFSVTSKIDSRTILGEGGAEQLLGMGDMLYMAAGGKVKRVHGPFVDDGEVEQVVSFLHDQGEPEYIDAVTDGGDESGGGFAGIGSKDRDGYDELYDQAVQIVLTERKASTSFVQRHLQIGYNRAARIIEQMEKDGLIGPANHVGKREILLETVE